MFIHTDVFLIFHLVLCNNLILHKRSSACNVDKTRNGAIISKVHEDNPCIPYEALVYRRMVMIGRNLGRLTCAKCIAIDCKSIKQ